MPSKKKKYNARFPPARIKKIMQKDEDVGKVAAPVPVLISKALEIFVEGLITKSSQHTLSRNAKTLTTSHIKQCIEQENKFDFLKELVENVPTISCEDEDSNHSGSFHSERHGNARRKHKIGRNESAQSSLQSVDDPSSDEESFTSDESSSKDERQRHPPEDAYTVVSAPSSSASLNRSSHSVPPAQVDCNPYPAQHQTASRMVFPPAMPPPLPLQYRALAGSTAAMGTYVVPHPESQRADYGGDSDNDYDV